MTTKERLHELVDELNDREADSAFRMLDARRREGRAAGAANERTVEDWEVIWGEPEMAPVPEDWGWGRLPSGTLAPNWVAVLDIARRGR